jgi:hypothetical protein
LAKGQFGRCLAALLDLRSLTLGNRITALGNERLRIRKM